MGATPLNHSDQGLTEDKLFRVLDLVSGAPRLSQRQLASSTGFSLGLVNLILKRLILTGHLKVTNLNKRKMEYILTSKGVMERTKRTSNYVAKTVGTFLEYQRRLRGLIREFVGQGHRHFAIVGEGEIVSLVQMALAVEGAGVSHRLLANGEKPRANETVLDCRHQGFGGKVGVSVLARLLEETTHVH